MNEVPNLCEPPRQKSALALVGRELESAREAPLGLSEPAEPFGELGSSSVKEMEGVERAALVEGIQNRKRLPRPLGHGDCDGAVQPDDGRRLDSFEHVVEPFDRGPVRFLFPTRREQ